MNVHRVLVRHATAARRVGLAGELRLLDLEIGMRVVEVARLRGVDDDVVAGAHARGPPGRLLGGPVDLAVFLVELGDVRREHPGEAVVRADGERVLLVVRIEVPIRRGQLGRPVSIMVVDSTIPQLSTLPLPRIG